MKCPKCSGHGTVEEPSFQFPGRKFSRNCNVCLGTGVLPTDHETEAKRLRAVLARLSEWTKTFGAELKPRGADTYGEGVRDSKEQVARIIDMVRLERDGGEKR